MAITAPIKVLGKEASEYKTAFAEIYHQYIKREGADKLFAFLESRDFFSAPASTRFHNAFEGGLCAHSINVFRRLVDDYEAEAMRRGVDVLTDKVMEALTIVSLLHDICKLDCYNSTFKNKKVYSPQGKKYDENGNFDWVSVPGFEWDEKLPFGHGEKSVFMIMQFMRLEVSEAIAIRFHMGDFVNERSTSDAYNKYTLATMLHIADLKATYLDELDPALDRRPYSFKVGG